MGIGYSSQYNEINTRIDGKTVLITGAGTGMGKYTAQELYKVGGRIIMACIDTREAEQAAEEIRNNASACDPKNQVGELVIKKLDLASMTSIRTCARDIMESEKQINILINNAGVLLREYQTTDDGFEMHFGTNYLGHFYFTYLLLPKILCSTPARIINISSFVHATAYMHWDDLNLERNFDGWSAYAQSKLAIILFTRELARRLKGSGVSTYSVNPGPTLSTMVRNCFASFMGTGFWLTVAEKLNNIYPFLNTIEEGAATGLYCALNKSLADESGFYYTACAQREVAAQARSDEDVQRLWDESLKLLGLEDLDTNKIQAFG